MKQIIVKDYETSDSRVNFGQIIQAGILITDDKLKIKQKHELSSLEDADVVVFNSCTVKGPTETFFKRKLP